MILHATIRLTGGEESSIAIPTRSIIFAIRRDASTMGGAAGIAINFLALLYRLITFTVKGRVIVNVIPIALIFYQQVIAIFQKIGR